MGKPEEEGTRVNSRTLARAGAVDGEEEVEVEEEVEEEGVVELVGWTEEGVDGTVELVDGVLKPPRAAPWNAPRPPLINPPLPLPRLNA